MTNDDDHLFVGEDDQSRSLIGFRAKPLPLGLHCPECGSDDDFTVAVTASVIVCEGRAILCNDPVFEIQQRPDAWTTCNNCDHSGERRHFVLAKPGKARNAKKPE